MNKRRWLIYGSVVIAVIVGVVALPVYFINQPLRPSLELITPASFEPSPEPVMHTTAVVMQSAATPEPKISTGTPITFVTPDAGNGVCGHKGKVNMLMLGMNLPEGGLQGANAIRLVVVDYDQPSVRILALPPNLWVKTTTLKDVDATLLTMAFAYGQVPPPLGNPAAVRNATQVVAQALLDNFGYKTEKYLTLDQTQFKNLVDTLDGVEVNVLEYADGTPEGFGIYEPGMQLMNGQRALEYIRLAQTAGQPPNEWSRLSRQNQVIKGIQNDLLKPENWVQIPRLINDFYRLLVTNLSPNDLLDLNCVIAEVGGNVTVLEVMPEMVINASDAVLIPDEAAIRTLILELQAGS